jgi:hypothetical protein
MSNPESTPTHLPWATLCQIDFIPQSGTKDLASGHEAGDVEGGRSWRLNCAVCSCLDLQYSRCRKFGWITQDVLVKKSAAGELCLEDLSQAVLWSVTFWYGSGSDPCHLLPDPDPALFVSGFQAAKKAMFFFVFCVLPFEGTFTLVFQGKQ